MNNGAFGENFPYSNFHDLNMDWIIKIAKDFLDQYTNIQNTITEGMEGLDNKAQELKALLQQWYDTHSNDIANQLADALNDLNNWYTQHQGYLDQYLQDSIVTFNTTVEQKAQETIESIPTDYSELSSDVNKLEEIVNSTRTVVDLQASLTMGALYSMITKSKFNNARYGYYLIQATEADDIYVTAMSQTNVPIAMFYSSESVQDATTWLGSQGSYEAQIQYTDEHLNIPTGTKLIAINNWDEGIFNIKRTMISENQQSIIKQVSLQFGNGIYHLINNNMIIDMGKTGGNNLFDFIAFKNLDNTVIVRNSSDFFAPYKVRAISNADGDLPNGWYGHFTGGNHQYNNSGSGSTATARCVIEHVLIDNKEYTDGFVSGRNIEIQWSNYIQGQNTKKSDGTGREILKETYTLRYDGETFNIKHNFVPLEDIIIITYYGLQIYNNTSNRMEYFVGGSNRTPQIPTVDTNSGSKNCREIIIENDQLFTSMKISNVDIGNFDLNVENYSAFSTTYNKAYFLLIQTGNTTTVFSANNYYYFEGSYVFRILN